MSSEIALAYMFALLCAAIGVQLWSSGAPKRDAKRFFERAHRRTVQRQAAGSRLFSELDDLMRRANVRHPRSALSIWVIATGIVGFVCETRSGPVMAATSVAISALCFHAILAARAQKRSQRIVQQLPAFLDDIVCLVGHGNSFPLAFQAAAADAQAPLSECLEQVTSRLHSGTEIDQALAAAARIYRVKELELIGAVLRISIRFGGHSDMVLERLASSMRELEQPDRGRVAPSAETHLSPWVLGLLPALLGGAVIVLNAGFLESIWGGALDEHLVYGAIGLQALGAYVLYRLARLRV